MTLERVLSILAFAIFFGFLLILGIYVPRLDLVGVIAVTILLCAYDLFIHRPPGGPHRRA